MKYIYDILLNFNHMPYEIYDWNKDDEITHIRKMPFYKVTTTDLRNIVTNNVSIDAEFLKSIYKKTEIIFNNKVKPIEYAFLLTDGKETIAIKDGKYSKLMYDEEAETLEYAKYMPIFNIKYKIISKKNHLNFKTRNEIYIKKFIFNEINNMLKGNEFDKLNYIYMEIFDKKISSDKNQIINDLNNNWDNIYLKLYNFLKIFSMR